MRARRARRRQRRATAGGWKQKLARVLWERDLGTTGRGPRAPGPHPRSHKYDFDNSDSLDSSENGRGGSEVCERPRQARSRSRRGSARRWHAQAWREAPDSRRLRVLATLRVQGKKGSGSDRAVVEWTAEEQSLLEARARSRACAT